MYRLTEKESARGGTLQTRIFAVLLPSIDAAGANDRRNSRPFEYNVPLIRERKGRRSRARCL